MLVLSGLVIWMLIAREKFAHGTKLVLESSSKDSELGFLSKIRDLVLTCFSVTIKV